MLEKPSVGIFFMAATLLHRLNLFLPSIGQALTGRLLLDRFEIRSPVRASFAHSTSAESFHPFLRSFHSFDPNHQDCSLVLACCIHDKFHVWLKPSSIQPLAGSLVPSSIRATTDAVSWSVAPWFWIDSPIGYSMPALGAILERQWGKGKRAQKSDRTPVHVLCFFKRIFRKKLGSLWNVKLIDWNRTFPWNHSSSGFPHKSIRSSPKQKSLTLVCQKNRQVSVSPGKRRLPAPFSAALTIVNFRIQKSKMVGKSLNSSRRKETSAWVLQYACSTTIQPAGTVNGGRRSFRNYWKTRLKPRYKTNFPSSKIIVLASLGNHWVGWKSWCTYQIAGHAMDLGH